MNKLDSNITSHGLQNKYRNALKAQNGSEGFSFRGAPIDSTERKKQEIQRDDYVTYQSNMGSHH